MILIFFLLFILLAWETNGERNLNYNQSASTFVQQYYQQFDSSRQGLPKYYDVLDSTMSFNGEIFFGSKQILDKITQIPKIINRNTMIVDSQPKIDGGIVVNIFGKVQMDNGTALNNYFNELLILEFKVTSFFIQHQILRFYGNGGGGRDGNGAMSTRAPLNPEQIDARSSFKFS